MSLLVAEGAMADRTTRIRRSVASGGIETMAVALASTGHRRWMMDIPPITLTTHANKIIKKKKKRNKTKVKLIGLWW